MSVILKAENISKQYRLGKVGTGTLSHDLNRWWHLVRGKEDPYLKVGAVNDRSSKATEDYVWALQDINFEVKTGEVLGIIGKNGAGKSTLLKILSRVTSPTTGSIKTRGRIASLLEVGTGFHPELTGRENIYLNGAILGMTKPEIKTKLDEIVAFSGCEMYIDTPVKRYSSGMRVRLGFAVAAHLEPEILVVDEVLAVGDAEFQKKAIGKMQDLSTGEGRTVLFVSHNMGSVKSLCSKAMVLENGVSVFEGNVDEGISFYASVGEKDLKKKWQEKIFVNKINFLNFQAFNCKTQKKIHFGDVLGLGEKIKITLVFKVLDDLVDLSLAFDIENINAELISHVTNEDDKMYFPRLFKNQIVEVTIETAELLFSSGLYRVNLWVGTGHTETFHTVGNFMSFQIEQSDFTGRTRALPKHAKTYLPSYWNAKILDK